MKNMSIIFSFLCLTALSLVGAAMAENEKHLFALNVDRNTGAIHVPEDYSLWPVLGTWSHAKVEGKPGVHEHHVVYTQPSTIRYYRKKGRFPDGAVLVKELAK